MGGVIFIKEISAPIWWNLRYLRYLRPVLFYMIAPVASYYMVSYLGPHCVVASLPQLPGTEDLSVKLPQWPCSSSRTPPKK